MVDPKVYNDAHSRAVFMRFEAALKPLLAQVAPDWLLHHMELRRDIVDYTDERVEIRLVIKPIGSARVADDSDLSTGPKRLPNHGASHG